jgi:hypothetical protein
MKKSALRIGPLGYRLESHRVVAFHDIQERTNSEYGNGHSRLRTVTDVEGNTTTHEFNNCIVDVKSDRPWSKKSVPKDSRTLLRLRFEARKEHYSKFCLWCLELRSVHAQLLASPRSFAPPESTTPHTFDKKVLKEQYTTAVPFLQQNSPGGGLERRSRPAV